MLNWVHKKMYCDANGIKYLHGVECYMTETLREKKRDNYHTILIAKNHDGVRELNLLMSKSEEEDHFYYKNRISFDEFLRISPNIIKISACLASPLSRLDMNNPYYERLAKAYDYYEIQPHVQADQVVYNRHLAQLAQKYHKPLIAGTDTHSLNKYKAECRSILLAAKHIAYSDEDAFDLTYKSYAELTDMFAAQDALPSSLYLPAIENTLVMADSVERFELDTSFKYPILYGSHEQDAIMYESNVAQSIEQKFQSGVIPNEQQPAFRNAVQEEGRVFGKVDMKGFMLFMSELTRWCKSSDIPVGFNRGSVGGSRVAYCTDITDLNPEQWHTVFSRFCNEDRKEIGDIDIDVSPDDRDRVYDYIIKRFGQDYSAFILAIGTISAKGTIDEIGRALATKYPDKYSLALCDRIKKEFEMCEQITRDNYPELFYYYDGLIDTAISQSMHPAGIVVSPITLADNYGTICRDGKVIIQIDMEAVHEVSLVKYDILGLKNIQIIRDTYRLLNKPYPQSHEINWDDQDVWRDILRSPVGIFQFESLFAHKMLSKFKPTSISDMSLVTAAIRPSGASYRESLINREFHKNPSELIDEMLADNNGFLVYQEDTLKFLQQICGLSGSEADNVRRAIGRKDAERLQAALPQILEGYCSKSTKPRAQSEAEAKEFLQIIEDSASYQFGMNHSIGYCMIGYLCAYLRYHYPYEFVTAYLNNAGNEDDIINGSAVAQLYNITITPPKFGISKDEYVFDKEQRIIAKGISSIKYLNKTIAKELYQLANDNTYEMFSDLLFDISNKTSVDSRQLNILIRIGFFSQFGNPATLLAINNVFTYFKNGAAKSVKKDKENPYSEFMPLYAIDKNAKGEILKTWAIVDCVGLIKACEKQIVESQLPDETYKEKAATQLEFLGYVDLTTGKESDRRKILVTNLIPLKSKATGLLWGYKVDIRSVGSGKVSSVTVYDRAYRSLPFSKGDILYASSLKKNERGYWMLYDYEKVV
jgi:DNA polymerase-3 subunit alpha